MTSFHMFRAGDEFFDCELGEIDMRTSTRGLNNYLVGILCIGYTTKSNPKSMSSYISQVIKSPSL